MVHLHTSQAAVFFSGRPAVLCNTLHKLCTATLVQQEGGSTDKQKRPHAPSCVMLILPRLLMHSNLRAQRT